MGQCLVGDRDAAQHARDLLHPSLSAQAAQIRVRLAALAALLHLNVLLRERCYLGKVRHAQYLPVLRQALQLAADYLGDPATDQARSSISRAWASAWSVIVTPPSMRAISSTRPSPLKLRKSVCVSRRLLRFCT